MNTLLKEEDRSIPDAERTIRIRAKSAFTVDGENYSKGTEATLTPRQYHAVARFCELLDGPEHPAPQAPAYTRVQDRKGNYTWKEGTPGPLSYEAEQAEQSKRFSDAVATAVKATLESMGIKGAAKAASLIALLFLAFSFNAKAAAPSTYGPLPLTMNTNGCVPGSTNVALTSIIGLTKFDQCMLTVTNQELGGSSVGTLTNFIFVYPVSDAGVADTNHPVATVTETAPNSTNGIVITNLSNLIVGSIGRVQVGIGNVGGGIATTNIGVTVDVKPIRAGT
jgi:hypothetical protein